MHVGHEHTATEERVSDPGRIHRWFLPLPLYLSSIIDFSLCPFLCSSFSFLSRPDRSSCPTMEESSGWVDLSNLFCSCCFLYPGCPINLPLLPTHSITFERLKNLQTPFVVGVIKIRYCLTYFGVSCPPPPTQFFTVLYNCTLMNSNVLYWYFVLLYWYFILLYCTLTPPPN